MSLVVTVLDATVAPERIADLKAAYREAERGPFPPGLVQSSLLQDASDPTQWRIETTWESREALVAMRRTGKPRGVQIFEAAGAAPVLSVFDTVAELRPPRRGAMQTMVNAKNP